MSEPDTSSSSSAREDSSSSRWLVWTLLTIFLPVLYLLSVTPLALLSLKLGWSTHSWAPPPWLRYYGAPAEWLYQNTPLETPLTVYRDWCIRVMIDPHHPSPPPAPPPPTPSP